MSLPLGLYRFCGRLLGPVARLHLERRSRAGKEDPARLPERLGIAGRPRPAGPLVWVHAASIGEAVSVLPLVRRLRAERAAATVLVTTGTVTSAALLARDLPDGAFHQYAPVDLPAVAEAFLSHWRPDLAIWVESEFWPSLLAAVARRRLPLVLVNGRLSERSFRRWRRLPKAAAELLGIFDLCFAQSQADGRRLAALGARRVLTVGNLKFAAPPLPWDAAELARLEAALAGRPRWLAASTHPGEEQAALAAHCRLAGERPDLMTLLVPRHPVRGAEVAALARAAGLAVSRRGAGEPIGPETRIYVADTIGEMGLWYRLAPVVLVGGSLVPHGGQNPLEPARLGAAVLFGPAMSNFAEIAEGLVRDGGAVALPAAADLAAAVAALLGDDERRRRMADQAAAFAASQAESLERLMAALSPLLDQRLGPAGG